MKLLLEANIASHYRAPIYKLIDKEIGCDFCFGDKWRDIKKMDYTCLRGRVIEVHNILFKGIEYQRGVLNLLRQDYDTYIIYTGTHCASSWFFLIIKNLFYRKKRVFAWTHGMLSSEGYLKKWMTKIMFSMLTGAFIYNKRSTKLLVDIGVSPDKLHIIYNSLDYDKQLSLRQSLKSSDLYKRHFNNSYKNIVFIGRLTKEKRFDLLLDAVILLKERGVNINVTLIGDGSERMIIEKYIEAKGIKSQVWLYGACYDERTNAELIYNADLCVSPGEIGLTAIHALMFGCPTITQNDFNHQGPEFEAIQEGISGAFFKVGDYKSLADTISLWFSEHSADRQMVREACFHEIDTKWNPHRQIDVFKKVLFED